MEHSRPSDIYSFYSLKKGARFDFQNEPSCGAPTRSLNNLLFAGAVHQRRRNRVTTTVYPPAERALSALNPAPFTLWFEPVRCGLITPPWPASPPQRSISTRPPRWRRAMGPQKATHRSSQVQFVRRKFGPSAGAHRISEVPMKRPLLIVLTAFAVATVTALSVMNNACKSSSHAWCAPMPNIRHHAKTSRLEQEPAANF